MICIAGLEGNFNGCRPPVAGLGGHGHGVPSPVRIALIRILVLNNRTTTNS
jgi:hypothetical protein